MKNENPPLCYDEVESCENDRFIDPAERQYQDEPYDARIGANGQPRVVSDVTHKTRRELSSSRPLVNKTGDQIKEPSLEEGVSSVRRMVCDDGDYI